MPATSTISVSCPHCGDPATVSLTTTTVDGDDQILDFLCPRGHHVNGIEAMHLWVSAHEQAVGNQEVRT
jgi:hypothetical protein